jgi:NAD(P) transhydrogenase subunit alpha
MTGEVLLGAYVLILAAFTGFEVISKVPSTLHTPLMSGANAIHGIIVVGAMLVVAALPSPFGLVLGFLAVVLGTANVVGGFVVTDRMLGMFRAGRGARGQPRAAAAERRPG